MHPEALLRRMARPDAPPVATLTVSGHGDGSKYARLHTVRLGPRKIFKTNAHDTPIKNRRQKPITENRYRILSHLTCNLEPKGKCYNCSTLCSTSLSRRSAISAMDHTVLPAITPMPLPRKRSPDGASQTEVADI